MNSIFKELIAFVNSAEGYFHKNVILQEKVKHPKDLYVKDDHPEKWDYSDIRDFTQEDLNKILQTAKQNIDPELFKSIPSAAITAALDFTIHTLDKSKYQKKIDAPIYNFLQNELKKSFNITNI